MDDQASELRKLVLRSMRESMNRASPAPRLMVISGAQEGVGATTLAVNLAVAFAVQGCRVVLVDADTEHADIARRLGLPPPAGPHPPAKRLDIHELLVRGPAGILVVPGLWSPRADDEVSDAMQYRVIHQLQRFGLHADMVLMDVGCGCSPLVHRFWEAAQSVLLVTSSDAVSVMNAYAAIKRHGASLPSGSVHLIVNQVDAVETAEDVYQRIDHSCRRFLGLQLGTLGMLPSAPGNMNLEALQVPVLLGAPQGELAKAIERLAASLAAWDHAASLRKTAA